MTETAQGLFVLLIIGQFSLTLLGAVWLSRTMPKE